MTYNMRAISHIDRCGDCYLSGIERVEWRNFWIRALSAAHEWDVPVCPFVVLCLWHIVASDLD